MKGNSLFVLVLFTSLGGCLLLRPSLSEWLALGLMVCAGIPHGAFDLRVAEAKWQNIPGSRAKILVSYLAGTLAMTSLCVFLPLVGISLFLVISAIHFSEGESCCTTPPSPLYGTLFGVSAILLPIGLHLESAQRYLEHFVPQDIFALASPYLQSTSWVVALIIAISLLVSLQQKKYAREESAQRLICLVAWIVLPPLAGFAVWFIGRHSRQHLQTCRAMFCSSGIPIPMDFALISLLAIGGILPLGLYFDLTQLEQLFAASLCLIAGLTLPHMVVSHRIRDLLTS